MTRPSCTAALALVITAHGCGPVTALPPLPTEDARAGLLVQGGSEPAVLAFALGPGQPTPSRAAFEAESVPPLFWLTYTCPLSTLGLSPGRQPLTAETRSTLLLPDPLLRFAFEDDAWTGRLATPEADDVLRRLDLSGPNFCPGSVRGVEVESRLLSADDPGGRAAYARILPFGDRALVLRGFDVEREREVEFFVDGSTVSFTESVRRNSIGVIHQLDLSDDSSADTLRPDSSGLPFLEGTVDGGGVRLWGRGQSARFPTDLGVPRFEFQPLLRDAEAIYGLGWRVGPTDLAVLVVDDQPKLMRAPQRNDPRVRRLEVLGAVDGVLRSIREVTQPLDVDVDFDLLRLEDGSVLIRGLNGEQSDFLFVRWTGDEFVAEARTIEDRGPLRRIEGQTYLLGADSDDKGDIYEGGLFVGLPARPTWPFLDRVERHAFVQNRSLFNSGGLIAEQVADVGVCEVAQLGRDEWAAVEVWADRWAFLEEGRDDEAALFLVRPASIGPACSVGP